MQVIVNHELIKRKARVGQIAFVVGLIGLAVGFMTSWQMSESRNVGDWSAIALSYGALIGALIALSVGRYHIARWSRRPRPDQAIAEALKGLDPRNCLLSYLPTVPVEHLLITPRGLVVLVAKHVYGEIRNRGNRWHRKLTFSTIMGGYSEGSVGNPSAEALAGVASVKSRLAAVEGLESIPVGAAIVFTDRRAFVSVVDPAVPVIKMDDLPAFVRSLDSKMAPDRIDQLINVFAPDRRRYQLQDGSKVKTKSKAKLEAPRRPKRRPVPPPAQDQSKMGRNRAERRMR